MKKILVFLVFVANLWGLNVDMPSLDLFASPTVSATQALKLGDIVGAIFVGLFTYVTIVLPFVIGIIGMGEQLFKSGQGGGQSGGGSTIIKLALTPVLWLVGGAVVFAVMHIFLNIFYSVDIYSWIKMFLEVRYETSVNSLAASGTSLAAAKSALLFLDISSKVAFWSIPAIFLLLLIFLFLYIISLFMDSSGEDSGFKKVFSGLVAFTIALVIVAMYESSVSRVMFKSAPTIAPVGTVSSAKGAFSSSLKHWIKTGLR